MYIIWYVRYHTILFHKVRVRTTDAMKFRNLAFLIAALALKADQSHAFSLVATPSAAALATTTLGKAPPVAALPFSPRKNFLKSSNGGFRLNMSSDDASSEEEESTSGATPAASIEDTTSSDGDSAAAAATGTVDVMDLVKYVAATGLQWSVLAGSLKLMDMATAQSANAIPAPLVGMLFCFLSLRSRVASFLDNSRPNREALKGKATPSDIKRPSWTPPGIAFPFIWLTITALRGISSALVYTQTKQLACMPLFAMLLHLCIGDTWNCITNIEKRLGVSALGVLFVWGSVWNAIVRYYNVLPLAGKLLAPSGVWISIATVLTFSIWRLNKPVQSLFPVKGDGKSAQWKWDNLGQLAPTTIRGSK